MKRLWASNTVRWVFILCVFPLSGWANAESDLIPYQSLGLVSRAYLALPARLDQDEQQWLQARKKLVVGVSSPDYPPLDIIINNTVYDGVTAEYVALLAKVLQTPVEIHQYPSRERAIKALKAGEIDVLGSSNSFELADSDLTLSESYLDDQPVLLTRLGDDQVVSSNLAGKRIAMLNHYIPAAEVLAFYRGTTLQLFPSVSSAIGAVAFGQADVYLGDIVSTGHLINNGFFKDIRASNFSAMHVADFSFSLMKSNQTLKHLVDKALLSIPPLDSMAIIRRWDLNGAYLFGNSDIQYSDLERDWIKQHPQIKVMVDSYFPPFSMVKKNGEVEGIVNDLFSAISLRTGLAFKLIPVTPESETVIVDALMRNEVDVIGALSPNFAHDSKIAFSRPYLVNTLVLVANKDSSTSYAMASLSGKRVATLAGSPVNKQLQEEVPNVQLIELDSVAEGFELVSQGLAEAVVDSLVSAEYKINHKYPQLKVISTIGVAPEAISFAMLHDNNILYSILDKALLTMPAQKIDTISNYWTGDQHARTTFWEQNKKLIFQGATALTLLMFLFLGWAIYLRQQVVKRRIAEKALGDQLGFMNELIDGTPHPIYVRDKEGFLLHCNASYLEALSVRKEDVIGRLVTDGALSDHDEALRYKRDYEQVLKESIPIISDRQIILKEPRQNINIYHWIIPYHDVHGNVKGVIGGWIDISARKTLEENLTAAKDQANIANKAKTTFLATMSHEIRTPLNAVIGMLEMSLIKADQGELDRFAIEVAYESANGLLDLIGNILDVVKIESGHLSLAPTRANIKDVVLSVVRVFQGLARQKGLIIKCEIDDNATCDVLVDSVRFKQVASNLVANAIKFTDRGEVVVKLARLNNAEAAGQHATFELSIADTGCGISAEDQGKIFSPFIQVSSSESARKGGTGLGLVISKALSELMGGTLELMSIADVGTCVKVRLSLPVLDAQQVAPKTPDGEINASLNELIVLIVDDHPANLMLLSRQLIHLGCKVIQADNASDALKLWESTPIDVLITDCNMPGISGYELVASIRRLELSQNRSRTFVLGFTANAQTDERERCIDAGMDDCIFKPARLGDLTEKLSLVQSSLSPGADAEPVQGLDLSALQYLEADTPEALDEFLGKLIKENELDVSSLHACLPIRPEALAGIAHKIKGGAQIIAAAPVVLQCDALESAANGNAPIAELRTLVLNLEEAIIELNDRLQALRKNH